MSSVCVKDNAVHTVKYNLFRNNGGRYTLTIEIEKSMTFSVLKEWDVSPSDEEVRKLITVSNRVIGFCNRSQMVRKVEVTLDVLNTNSTLS